MRRVLLVALALRAAPAAADYEPYFTLDSFAHAEPVPIEAFRKDWNAKRESGGDALLHSRAETGLRFGDWSVGYVARMDYELKASDGAAALYHRAKNKAAFAPGETFDLRLRAWHLEAQGLRLARRWAVSEGFTVQAGLSLLEGTALTDGVLTGTASAPAANDYDFDVDVDYRYSDDALFKRRVSAPHGRGFSLDLGAQGRTPGRLEWRLELRDVYGRMEWDSAPNTTASADSSNKRFGSDGYATYNPTLSGREGFEHFHQRIHPRGLAEIAWQPEGEWGGGLRLRASEVALYPSLLARYTRGDWRHELELLPREGALGISAGWKGLSLSWLADRLDVDQAHALSLQIMARHSF